VIEINRYCFAYSFTFPIQRSGRPAKLDLTRVFLWRGWNEPGEPGRLPNTDGQHPGCHRIERAKMTDLACRQALAYPLNDVMGRHSFGLVDDGQPAKRWRTFQDEEDGVGDGRSEAGLWFIWARIRDTISS